jgi:hypothetical protein
VGGAVANTRLAMRKQRDGISGIEVPFTVRIAEIGTDEDGDPVTAPIVEWQASQQTSHADIRWTQSMQLLRRVLMTILVDSEANSSAILGRPRGARLRYPAGARRILPTMHRRRHRTAKSRGTTQGFQPLRKGRAGARCGGVP